MGRDAGRGEVGIEQNISTPTFIQILGKMIPINTVVGISLKCFCNTSTLPCIACIVNFMIMFSFSTSLIEILNKRTEVVESFSDVSSVARSSATSVFRIR